MNVHKIATLRPPSLSAQKNVEKKVAKFNEAYAFSRLPPPPRTYFMDVSYRETHTMACKRVIPLKNDFDRFSNVCYKLSQSIPILGKKKTLEQCEK